MSYLSDSFRQYCLKTNNEAGTVPIFRDGVGAKQTDSTLWHWSSGDFPLSCQFSPVTRTFLPNLSAFLAVWPWPTHVTSLSLTCLACTMRMGLWRLDDVIQPPAGQQWHRNKERIKYRAQILCTPLNSFNSVYLSGPQLLHLSIWYPKLCLILSFTA